MSLVTAVPSFEGAGPQRGARTDSCSCCSGAVCLRSGQAENFTNCGKHQPIMCHSTVSWLAVRLGGGLMLSTSEFHKEGLSQWLREISCKTQKRECERKLLCEFLWEKDYQRNAMLLLWVLTIKDKIGPQIELAGVQCSKADAIQVYRKGKPQ